MKKFSLKLLLSVSLMVLGVALSAQAAPFMLPGNTPIYFQFNNLEQVDLSLRNSLIIPDGYNKDASGNDIGQGNWGVFNLSSIQKGGVSTPNEEISGGTNIWDNSATNPRGQIHGVFGGINLNNYTQATGGWMDLYYTDSMSIDEDDMNGSTKSITKFVAGTFLARLNFMPGVENNNTTTVLSYTDLSTAFPKGLSDSFADVDLTKTGLWTPYLDGNWFNVDTDNDGIKGEAGEIRDVRFSTIFTRLSNTSPWSDPTNSILGLKSNDPGRVFTVVPEPASVLLLGIGLLGFAGALRRKV